MSWGSVVPLVDKASALRMLRVAAPEWKAFLASLEDGNGRLRFRSGLLRAIKSLGIEGYPVLYESEQAIGAVLAKALMSDATLREWDSELVRATPEERGGAAQYAGDLIEALIDSIQLPDFVTPEQEAAMQAAILSLPERERAECIRTVQLLLAGALALFYEQLSLLVHGERMTALVAQAKAGDDSAFSKAVQIDGRVLVVIPYFRERFAQARMADETEFLSRVWRRQSAAPYKGRIEHKGLYLMFSFLDSVGLLKTFTHRQLLDLYDELGLGARRRRIEDETNMGKRLAEYRRFQKRRHVSTP